MRGCAGVSACEREKSRRLHKGSAARLVNRNGSGEIERSNDMLSSIVWNSIHDVKRPFSLTLGAKV